MKIFANGYAKGLSESYLHVLARRKRKWFFGILLAVFIPIAMWSWIIGIDLTKFVWETTAASGIFAGGVSIFLDRTIK